MYHKSDISSRNILYTKKATYTQEGQIRYTCKDCGATRTETISKTKETAHKWGKWTKLNDKKHQRVCEYNKTHIQTADHNWNKGLMTKTPTTSKTGLITYTCKDCGATKTEEVAKLSTVNVWAKMMPTDKKSLLVSWFKVKGVDGYRVYFAPCTTHESYNSCRRVKTITNNNKFKFWKTGLKKGKCYKAYVEAYKLVNGKKVVVGKSMLLHSISGKYNKTYSNAKRVKLTRRKVTIKKGKTYTIKKPKIVLYKKKRKNLSKGHGPKFRYASSNSKVATVSSEGVITARGTGTCRIYVVALNGVRNYVKVTVK